MLTALILVCSLASVPDLAACNRDSALEMVQVPATFANPVTCLMHGQAYLAATSIGRELAENEAVKVVCVRTHSAELGPLPPESVPREPTR
jgi:hypothetical protein